jgi:predicted Zn-dependent protease
LITLLVLVLLLGSFVKGNYAMTTEEEKKLGKKILLEMEQKVEVMKDLTLQTFIDKIGHLLVAQIGPTPFEFKFYLIKAQDPNAFAIPGGYIFLTTGLIVLAENEQEIAGVLSHEISHVTQRHIARMIEKSKGLNIATLAAILAGMLVGGGGAGSQAAVAMATATAGALTLKYTREMETDADQNSLHLLIKAGYDPNGMISFLNKIYRMSLSTAPQIPVYLLTHPAVEDRISLLENLLQSGQRPMGPFKTVGNFKRIQTKVFVEEREPDIAVSHFESMVKTNSKNIDEVFGLALAFKKMGRLDRSIEILQNALSLAPKDPDLLRELGIVYFLSGKLDLSIETLGAVRSIPTVGGGQADDLLSLYYLGRGYQEKGDFAKARPIFLKLQKEVPDFIDIYLNLGSVYGRTGEKGLSHFYFGKHFKWRGERNNALLHFRTSLEWLERGRPEREEAQREIKELSQTK